MFYDFTSDQITERVEWPLVWEIENRIAALLMDNLRGLRNMGRIEIEELLLDELLSKRAVPSEEVKVFVPDSMNTIRRFVRQEVPHILKFIGDCRGEELSLIPNKHLAECLDASDDFRSYVQMRAKVANSRFEKFNR